MKQQLFVSGLFFILCSVAEYYILVLLPRLPAKWFCDYGETPNKTDITDKLNLSRGVRLLLAFITGFFAGAFILMNGFSVIGIPCGIIFLILMPIGVSDALFFIIPDEFTLALLLFFVPVYIANGISEKTWQGWFFPFAGAAAATVFLLLLNAVGKKIYRADVFGMGDTKLLAVCAFGCTLKLTVVLLFLSIVTAGIHFAILSLKQKDESKLQRPFAPYIVLATAVTFAFSPLFNRFLSWYFSLIL